MKFYCDFFIKSKEGSVINKIQLKLLNMEFPVISNLLQTDMMDNGHHQIHKIRNIPRKFKLNSFTRDIEKLKKIPQKRKKYHSVSKFKDIGLNLKN